MKNVITTLLLIAASLQLTAQEFNEKIAVPLSRPGEQGKLEVGLVRGDIKIETYNGPEVLIEATSSKNEQNDDDCSNCDTEERQTRSVPPGMKKIASSSIEFEVSESDNRVEIETESWKKGIDLVIKLPKNFDLEVSTVHGKVTVAGVEGFMEVSAVHGPLSFSDVSGSIVCNTVHGDVTANFKQVTSDEPMSFVTLHGNVDVTFPASIRATTKMKSDRGEIYTDFDMTVDKGRQEKRSTEDGYKVAINSWVFGQINGGGEEYTFKNMHGDIIIRKE